MDGIFARLDPKPSGFGNCGTCPYRDTGNVQICYACARHGTTALAETRCTVCDQALPTAGSRCGNPVCNWPDRQFDWNRAVALREGPLTEALTRYKYRGRTGWAMIFGRVLAGFLDERVETFSAFDLIIASPTFVGPGGRDFDHTSMVLAEAARLDERGLPFVIDDPVIVKTAPTKRLVECETWQERRQVCENEVLPALQVPDPSRLEGRHILVYDDVFTDGLNLNVVASVLRHHGASRVCGVTLARQPWGGLSTVPENTK
jgi:predicted amidophosphoribosyltransferase